MTKEEKFIMKWKKTREKGMKKYIIINGCLIWGLIVFILLTIVSKFLTSGFSFNFVYENGYIHDVIINAIFCPVLGYFIMKFNWKSNEAHYNEIKKKA